MHTPAITTSLLLQYVGLDMPINYVPTRNQDYSRFHIDCYMLLPVKKPFTFMIPNKASHCVSCLACISLPSLMLAGKSIMLRHYEIIYKEACICTRLLGNRSHDGTMLAFSSADGYCSTIVFDEEELGVIGKLPARESITMTPSIDNDISYEQQHATEKDVVMMDISSPPQPIRAEKRAAIATVTPQSDKTKKRRIAPTLISSSLPSSTISPCSSSRIFPNETQNQG